MTAKPEPGRLELPPGLTPEEEACWWDEHPEYWDTVDTELEVMEPQLVRRTQEVKLYLPVDLVEAIKQQAARQKRSYQSLLRAWIEERLDAEA